jgi:agmatine deiminase
MTTGPDKRRRHEAGAEPQSRHEPTGLLPSAFRMPAEWERHAATWIAWPHNADDWPGKFGPIPWVFAEVVRRLSRFERVCILVNDAAMEREATDILRRAGADGFRVEFFHVPTDRVWTRDFGPIFVKDALGRIALTDWGFNAWAKYDDWQHDDRVPARLAQILGLPCWQPAWRGRRVILEGGSLDVNGSGTLLTTEECLLSPVQQRNPELGREDLEQVLAEYLGVQKVLWLGRGIVGDDTHGHVDDIARFVGSRTVVAARETDQGDDNYEILRENWDRLQALTDQDGERLELVELPMPEPLFFDDRRLPASYANFYIANHCVLVPTFNDERDQAALRTLSDLFPDHAVIGIYCGDLVWGLGTLHCMTQQQPATGLLATD